MEDLALKINNYSDLSYYESFPHWEYTYNNFTRTFTKTLSRTLQEANDIEITRIYFGSEFCEYALPKRNDIQRIIRYCKNHTLKLTLLLPPLSEKFFTTAMELLLIFMEHKSQLDFEVSCNDYGTMFYLYQKYKDLRINRGRVLQKRIFDPRVDKKAYFQQLTDTSKLVFEASSLSSYEASLIRRMNICRIEIDTYCDELPYEMSVNYPFTIYLPFGFYTTGSLCLFRNLTLPSKKKFNLDSIKCGQSCKKFHQTMNKKFTLSSSFTTQDLFLFRAGNTVFYNNDIIGNLKLLEKNRVVIQPYPMI